MIYYNPRSQLKPTYLTYFTETVSFDSEDLSDIVKNNNFSHIQYKNSYRANKNFISSNMFILDFDGKHKDESSIKECKAALSKYSYVLFTTRSHHMHHPFDSFRVVFPLSKTIYNLDEYQVTFDTLRSFVQNELHLKYDEKCDATSGFYMSTEVEFHFERNEGSFIDLDVTIPEMVFDNNIKEKEQVTKTDINDEDEIDKKYQDYIDDFLSFEYKYQKSALFWIAYRINKHNKSMDWKSFTSKYSWFILASCLKTLTQNDDGLRIFIELSKDFPNDTVEYITKVYNVAECLDDKNYAVSKIFNLLSAYNFVETENMKVYGVTHIIKWMHYKFLNNHPEVVADVINGYKKSIGLDSSDKFTLVQ